MRIIVPLALCASSLIAGCASGLISNKSVDSDVDTARVAAINRVASGRGVDVHWVRYPQRKTDTDGAPRPAAAPGPEGSSMVLPIGT